MFKPIADSDLSGLKPNVVDGFDVIRQCRGHDSTGSIDDDQPIVSVHHRPHGLVGLLGIKPSVDVKE